MFPAVRRLLKSALVRTLLVDRLPESARGSVLLTFDDGPTPGVTEGVLDRLDAARARALFFVVGRKAAAAPELLAEIAGRGHLLGNHSWDHVVDRRLSPAALTGELRRCQDLVAEHAGHPPLFFRPPAGRIDAATLLAPRRLGLRTLLWSVDADDWRCRDEAEARAAAARIALVARSRDIVLLHDFASTAHALLDVLLPTLSRGGFDLAHGTTALVESVRATRGGAS